MDSWIHHDAKLDDFAEVVLLDTEFVAVDGEPVVPVCMVARELRSGRLHRIFFDQVDATYENPLPQGPDVLYVAYAAQAEWSVFIALGWDLPINVLDLFAEFRCLTNGLTDHKGAPTETSMIAALAYFGLDSLTVVEKQSMRDLILRGHPYTAAEEKNIIEYCAEDVEGLMKLLPVMLPCIDLPCASFRGLYTRAVARMEATGIPIDLRLLEELKADWAGIKTRLVRDVEDKHDFGVYQGTSWSDRRFAALLDRLGLLDEWPRTPTGLLCSEDDVFRTMAEVHPVLRPLRDVRSTLVHLRELRLTVGRDGRNRCSLKPFRSKTGRNYPASAQFIFGPSAWLRSLIAPEPGRAVAYIDWISAEVGIAAALSGDRRLQAAYESGDVYMAFAVDANAAPRDATKDTHGEVRDVYKRVMLAVQYGQGAAGLARTLGIPPWRAKELLDLHRRLYSRYWEWNEWTLQRAQFGRSIETVFGWPLHVSGITKQTTIANFPMQAQGSEMLRWACVYATDGGVEVHAPVQDALLVGGAAYEIKDVVALTRAAMAKASDLVLDGFVLRTDVKIVRHPDRYADKRGAEMWNRVLRLLSHDIAA